MARDLLWGHEVRVDGFGIWDIDGLCQGSSASWDMCSKADQREQLESLVEKPAELRSIRLKTVGGVNVLDLAAYSGG